MASWDEDDFTSPVAGVNVAGKGRWEGEDDEDDLPVTLSFIKEN